MMKKLFQTQCLPLFLALVVCAATLLTGCGLRNPHSPRGYDLGNPRKFGLGKVLTEISGIHYSARDSLLLAISDSQKKIFAIDLKNGKLRDYTGEVVGDGQDLEDLVKIGNSVYLLSSRGLIYEISLGRDTAVRSYPFDSEEKNDFETLYHDPSVNGLIMLCKTCASDKGEQRRSAFRFDLQSKKFDSLPFYMISTGAVRALVKNDEAKFDPSAASIHPVDKKLYILSSAGNLMVIADTRGKPLEAFELNPDDHPQAEGIAFAPNGDMYISNEGKYGTPTLQIFKYHGKKK